MTLTQGCSPPTDADVSFLSIPILLRRLPPPVQGRELRDWHADDWQSFLTTTATLAGYIADVPAGRWWSAFLLTQRNTRARFDDLLAVRKLDIDLCSRSLDCGPHVYRLHPLTVEAVQSLIDGSDATLFPWPREEQRAGNLLGREVRQIAERSGLDVVRGHPSVDRRLATAVRRVPELLDRLTLPAIADGVLSLHGEDGIYDPPRLRSPQPVPPSWQRGRMTNTWPSPEAVRVPH